MLINKKFSKKGISDVIVTMILISIGIGAVAIVGTLVNDMLSKKMQESSSCYGIYNKVSINKEYSCYYYQGERDYRLKLSIGVDNIDIEGIKIVVKTNGTMKSFDLTNQVTVINNIKLLNGTTAVSIPQKNEGFAYLIYNLEYAPDSVIIAPVREGNLCSESDSMYEIAMCE